MKTKEISLISLLAVIIFITGMFKLPGIIPGTEFQLSAPIAIGIAVCFGFKRYLLSGIVSSALSLILGTQTIVNITVAMIFRIVAGGLIHILGPSIIVIIIAGPIGTIVARIILGMLIGKGITPLIIAAVPGMLYTSVSALPIVRIITKIKSATSWKEANSHEKII